MISKTTPVLWVLPSTWLRTKASVATAAASAERTNGDIFGGDAMCPTGLVFSEVLRDETRECEASPLMLRNMFNYAARITETRGALTVVLASLTSHSLIDVPNEYSPQRQTR